MSNQVKKEVTLGYRVGGVLIRNGKILLQSDPLVKFWVLPGGSPKPFEASDKALIRELKEEIGLQIETERLLFVIENSGEFGGRYFYGVELMYLIKPKGGSEILDQEEFIGIEDDLGDDPFYKDEILELKFKWFSQKELDSIIIKPGVLTKALQNIPNYPVLLQNLEIEND